MNTPSHHEQPDPIFIHTRREAIIILGVFVIVCVWTVSWCYLAGYNHPPGAPVVTVWGIPSWAFWGIAVPWLAADVFTILFCLGYMEDDDLDDVSADGSADGAAVTPSPTDHGEGRNA